MSRVELEICANSLTSALIAEEGGATRVEYCANLAEGGTTPSYGELAVATSKLKIPIFPIIRPRGGDFLYSDLEFEVMKADVIACKGLGCAGIVFGILTPEGMVDIERCKQLKDLAAPMRIVFHRAFDMSKSLPLALETLIDLGFERVLSSGGFPSALEGSSVLQALIIQAAGRIQVMPGSGINPGNVGTILEKTSAKAVHASLLAPVPSEMKFKNESAKMGKVADEYSHSLTSLSAVKEIITCLNQLNTT
jgi:copper homeostasis protein